jgi:hypothetical protein
MKRVNEWTLRIEPILEAQEEMKPFDIHEYSDEVLTTAHSVAEVKRKSLNHNLPNLSKEEIQLQSQLMDQISFREITAGKSISDICRLFLSCLQLTNAGNLEILSEGFDPTKLLLSSDAENGYFQEETNNTNTTKNNNNSKNKRNNKNKGILSQLTQPLPLPHRMSSVVKETNDDLMFKIKSTNRTKTVEQFRAPSSTHTQKG